MAKVLIVGDVKDDVELLRAHLASQGYEVLAAYYGRRAREVARAACPDGILLEVMMPDRDGSEAQAQKLRALGQLAAGIAHEINTPIQYIGDNTRFLQNAFRDVDRLLESFQHLLQAAKDGAMTEELVADMEAVVREADVGYLSDEIPKAIQQSLEGVGRVASIVRAMRGFVHPGGDDRQTTDVNRAIENTLAVSRNEWKYVADVVTDLDPHLPSIVCSPGGFSQVMLNLLVNAAQAIAEVVADGSRGKGTIEVSTRRQGNWAEIRVSDTGPGIPEGIRSQVFDWFFTTKDAGKGTGQGLSIAHSVVERYGGTIDCDSEVGCGTTFTIRLPVASGSVSPQPATARELVPVA